MHPRTRPSFCMSLRASAHTGVAIRSPRMETWPVGTTLGKSVALPRIRLRRCSLLCAAAGDADCHVASLLAMTCRRRAGVSIGNYVVPWQIRHAFRVRPKYCFLSCPTAGDADCHTSDIGHWFAMTCRRKDVCAGARTWRAMTCKRRKRFCGCKDVWRDNMQRGCSHDKNALLGAPSKRCPQQEMPRNIWI